jgi:hypothetical protein
LLEGKTATELDGQLSRWISEASSSIVEPSLVKKARAIIAPHAGYSYCGSTAGHAYCTLASTGVRRVFVVGPSHHVRLGGCALSPCSEYETPLGPLFRDDVTCRELEASGLFERMTRVTDEDEHSIEMHLPFVRKVLGPEVGVVVLLVGSLSLAKQAVLGRLLSKYLVDPESVFVISSDFCHWGQRFQYQFLYDKDRSIHDSIRALDAQGMQVIESLDPRAFDSYLKAYGNTICGRHPIGLLLSMIDSIDQEEDEAIKFRLKFTHYAQSSQCKSMEDSSVSYAAASLVLNQ